MIVVVMLKTPDALDYAIRKAVEEQCGVDATSPLGDEDTDSSTIESKICSIEQICHKWFKYGEIVQLKVDTEAQTCEVMPV